MMTFSGRHMGFTSIQVTMAKVTSPLSCPSIFANRFGKIEPIGKGNYSIATQTGRVWVKRLSLFLKRIIDPQKQWLLIV